ncbi:MAG: hypothetical protein AMQ22_00598 [Candidatus Methanofastidiosum methylothiophilum]|uniref:Uncharacterized protein n=1 Tax=Candidatus Methanofastidiosum methylothiophilum TaxID=1705564 RepID=A0A150J6E8_9EURY|nr:MAG: hypothetical protein AMQ22_00598 [Candidatus Methanofastidiosum methylthiophilus]
MVRIGCVAFRNIYIVDIDDEEMVENAKDFIIEDIDNAVKHNETLFWIDVKEDKNHKYTYDDIHPGLLDLKRIKCPNCNFESYYSEFDKDEGQFICPECDNRFELK